MRRKKPAITIDLNTFELPCSKPDHDAELEVIQEGLSTSALKVGIFEDEVDNFTSWKSEDHFFIYPWSDDEFDWALIRITLEDSWGRWEVESCARITDESDLLKAARRMLAELFAKWGYDLKSSEYRHYKSFIRRLSIDQ